MSPERPQWTDIAIVFLTLGILLAAILQTRIFERQWREMHDSGTDTHDLALAAKAQADASKAQSESTAKLADSTAQEVQQLQASVREAHAATEQSKHALQVSERPWLNADSIELTRYNPPSPTQEPLYMEARVAIKNTGRSVATDVWVKATAEPNRTETLLKDWRKPCRMIEHEKAGVAKARETGQGEVWPHGFVLAPGDTVETDLGDLQVDRWTLEKSKYWILGCASYKDEFGATHHTNFCFEPTFGSVPPKLKRCGKFEEAN